MEYTTLPNSDIKVSKICLGTMTWGNQNTEADGFDQMDYASSNPWSNQAPNTRDTKKKKAPVL